METTGRNSGLSFSSCFSLSAADAGGWKEAADEDEEELLLEAAVAGAADVRNAELMTDRKSTAPAEPKLRRGVVGDK